AGAFLLHFLIVYFQIQQILPNIATEDYQMVLNEGREVLRSGKNYTNEYLGNLNAFLNVPVVGASGALFGILVAFAMYWPNTELYIMFIPMPIKAKYAVMGYAAFELFSGISGFMPGVAHFAHLGGALFGYLLVKYWNKSNRSSLY
ncbi:MAG: rhomboid family intramembrane serine protease, partial [Bacteroidia bacterium]|nr:rhomboid family intramembrane serine protease [Bacteroidia bacterium]NNJ54499.1 rhomboid family intramembrane serine protease [Bacteroidia bacterium]